MSYEEYVNEEAVELTEGSAAPEETLAEETVENAETVEAVEEVTEVAAEEPVAEVVEETEIPSSEEALIAEPLVDEGLFDSVSEDDFDFNLLEEEPQAPDTLKTKCDEVRMACQDIAQRIADDLKQTNYNPYIRSTTTYKYEILKKSTDAEPVDVFEFQRTRGFSLRSMAITTVLVAAADLAVGKILKKKLKK